jgi:hypothetical protein
LVRTWAFWTGLITTAAWIGPRHTNFPDGSVCAFEPADGTWAFGDSLVDLMDLYTVWVLRHLHLQTVGRWPGYQSVRLPYERILELRPDEFCGCEQSHLLYGGCCRNTDLARDRMADAMNFFFFSQGRLREPPASVLRFVHEGGEPPAVNDVL